MKTRQIVLLAALASCLAVVAASFLTASPAVPDALSRAPGLESFELLCDSSTLIVDGYVVSVDESGLNRQALLQVNRVLKGSSPPQRILVSSGGMQRGNRYIAFLRENPTAAFSLSGGIPLYGDMNSPFLIVGDRVRLVSGSGPGFLRSKFEPLTLAEAVADIESYVQAPRVAGRIVVDGDGFPRPGSVWVVVTPVDVKTPRLASPARVAVATNGGIGNFPTIAEPGARIAAIGPDGAFTLPLLEGTYRVSMDGVPLGYSVKSIQYGSTDLASALLKIERSTSSEIRITLGADASKPASRGVKVSGRVTGIPEGPFMTSGLSAAPLLVSLRSGSQEEFIAGAVQVAVMFPGDFEFLNVPPGSYTLRVSPPPGIAPSWVFATTTVVVGQKNVKVKFPFQGREVKGQLVTAKNRPKLSEPTGAVMAFDLLGSSETLGAPSRLRILAAADNSFSVLLPHGEFTLATAVRGRSITSISAGPADLLKTPLKIDGKTSVKRILVQID